MNEQSLGEDSTGLPGQAAMRAALQAYVDLTNAGDSGGLVDLFAPDAVIEDPVGSPPKSGAEIGAWFADAVAFGTRILPVTEMRGSHANEAALVFEVTFTPPGGQLMRIRSLDVCTFNPSGRITRLRALWGPDDIAPATT